MPPGAHAELAAGPHRRVRAALIREIYETRAVMGTPYTGSGPYCYSNSLHMCLTQAGMAAVPPVSLLECMTGMPFGASFLALDPPLFFPSPGARTNPDRGLTRALDTIGWECVRREFEDAGAAEAGFREAIAGGPVLLGPLDMGGLLYDPLHQHKRGGDHFVVALAREGDRVRLHDPQLYPFAVLPLPDLMQAWSAKGIAYATATYTLRCGFRARRPVSEAEALARTLETAREMAERRARGAGGLWRRAGLRPRGRALAGPAAGAIHRHADCISGCRWGRGGAGTPRASSSGSASPRRRG